MGFQLMRLGLRSSTAHGQDAHATLSGMAELRSVNYLVIRYATPKFSVCMSTAPLESIAGGLVDGWL